MLCQVPVTIASVKSKLRTLDVSFNRIPVLPDVLGEFTNLRVLSFNNNRIGKAWGRLNVHNLVKGVVTMH